MLFFLSCRLCPGSPEQKFLEAEDSFCTILIIASGLITRDWLVLWITLSVVEPIDRASEKIKFIDSIEVIILCNVSHFFRLLQVIDIDDVVNFRFDCIVHLCISCALLPFALAVQILTDLGNGSRYFQCFVRPFYRILRPRTKLPCSSSSSISDATCFVSLCVNGPPIKTIDSLVCISVEEGVGDGVALGE